LISDMDGTMKNTHSIHISVVIPVYGAPELISELCDRLHKSLREITEDYEIILVFDCSPDNSWEGICKECKKDKRVKGIRLSRNFGQHYAIAAGLKYAGGDWVVVMDCDLQDQPEEIAKLYAKACEGYDIVFGQRVDRKDGFLKKMSSKLFHLVFSYMLDVRTDATVANFGIYHRRVIRSVLSLGDKVRILGPMVNWVGFNKTACPVDHANRRIGKSSYSLGRLWWFACDAIISFSNKPLKLCVMFGLSISFLALAVAVFYLIFYLIGHIKVSGFTSLIISIWFLAGIQLFFVGLIGVYVGKTFDGIKNRPSFIISDLVNMSENDEVLKKSH